MNTWLMISMLWTCCQRVRAAHWQSQALLQCIGLARCVCKTVFYLTIDFIGVVTNYCLVWRHKYLSYFFVNLCLLGWGGSVTNLSGIECTAKISAPALVTFRRAGNFFLYFHITPVFSYFIIINLKYIGLYLCTGLYKKNFLGGPIQY